MNRAHDIGGNVSRFATLAVVAGILMFALSPAARAADNPSQTVTVRVNLVVPQVTITKVSVPTAQRDNSRGVAASGLRISGPTNVVLRLNGSNGHGEEFHLGNGNTKVLTAKNLRGVSSVELNYFGS